MIGIQFKKMEDNKKGKSTDGKTNPKIREYNEEKLLSEYSQKMNEVIIELEDKLGKPLTSLDTYYGDVTRKGVEGEGFKVLLSTDDFFEETPLISKDVEYEVGESSLTPQEIIAEFHITESNIKTMMNNNLGLSHITDKYLDILKLEKEECRKALTDEHKDLFKYI